jgi:hypothetical protein
MTAAVGVDPSPVADADHALVDELAHAVEDSRIKV